MKGALVDFLGCQNPLRFALPEDEAITLEQERKELPILHAVGHVRQDQRFEKLVRWGIAQAVGAAARYQADAATITSVDAPNMATVALQRRSSQLGEKLFGFRGAVIIVLVLRPAGVVACEFAADGECRRVDGSRFPLLGAAEFANILIDGACREVVVAQVAHHRQLAHQGLSRRDDFAQAASRTPTLGWKASGDPDLSYDIAIFEARAIDQQGYKTQYIKGPVIEYAEGIKTARFKLKNELKAKTKY